MNPNFPDPTIPPGAEYGARFLDRSIARDAEPRRPRRAWTYYSQAGKCARQVALAAIDEPKTNPMDKAGHLATWLGTLAHEEIQHSTQVAFADRDDVRFCEVEKPSQIGDLVSGYSDLVVGYTPDRLVVVDYKFIGGFAFKSKVGAIAGREPEWFDPANVAQLALSVHAEGADEGRLVYIGKEAVSKGQRRRFGLDWFDDGFPCIEPTWTGDQLEPVAVAELDRLGKIRGIVDGGELPKGVIPGLPAGAVVESAARGTWVVRDEDGDVRRTGSAWQCDYCPFQDLCDVVGAGRRVPLSELVEARERVGVIDVDEAPEEIGAIEMGAL